MGIWAVFEQEDGQKNTSTLRPVSRIYPSGHRKWYMQPILMIQLTECYVTATSQLFDFTHFIAIR